MHTHFGMQASSAAPEYSGGDRAVSLPPITPPAPYLALQTLHPYQIQRGENLIATLSTLSPASSPAVIDAVIQDARNFVYQIEVDIAAGRLFLSHQDINLVGRLLRALAKLYSLFPWAPPSILTRWSHLGPFEEVLLSLA